MTGREVRQKVTKRLTNISRNSAVSGGLHPESRDYALGMLNGAIAIAELMLAPDAVGAAVDTGFNRAQNHMEQRQVAKWQ